MTNLEYVGEQVINKNGCYGVITSVDEFIHVQFEEKECIYKNDAFEKGFLEFVDLNLERKIALRKQSIQKQESEERLNEALKELNSLVGLKKVKSKIDDLVCQNKIFSIRNELGLKVPNTTKHMVFMGNPGTGKTTVARLVAKIFKELGILSSGHLVEADRSQLVAAYQGQTSIKTMNILKKALGGVLFIDEAYSLYRSDDDDFGLEALDTLTKFMEDHRDDLIVIVAGYGKEMVDFINANPGLSSRFKTLITFDNYKGEELFQIFNNFFLSNDYELTEDAKEKAIQHFKEDNVCLSNGRDIRNMFEKTIVKQAKRLNSSPSIDRKDLINICIKDLCLS